MSYARAEVGAHEILLVEDNPADVVLVREAFTEVLGKCHLNVATNADQALAYLRREREYVQAPRPHLILLDLNLPGRSGIEVLSEIKRDSVFAWLPVVVVTSSRSKADIRKCYDLHCNAYMTKPPTFDGYVELAQRLDEYWFSSVHLPSG